MLAAVACKVTGNGRIRWLPQPSRAHSGRRPASSAGRLRRCLFIDVQVEPPQPSFVSQSASRALQSGSLADRRSKGAPRTPRARKSARELPIRRWPGPGWPSVLATAPASAQCPTTGTKATRLQGHRAAAAVGKSMQGLPAGPPQQHRRVPTWLPAWAREALRHAC